VQYLGDLKPVTLRSSHQAADPVKMAVADGGTPSDAGQARMGVATNRL
jgi:hypothetical protein